MSTAKVAMSLTELDVANTEKIRTALGSKNNAHVVSIAISLTAFLVDNLKDGDELLLRNPRGELHKVLMKELAGVTDKRREDGVAT